MYRKSQMNIDLMVSYILFIFFIGFIINFSLKLTEPFTNTITIERENLEMSILLKKIPEKIDIEKMDSICSITQENLDSIKFEYTIIGFEVPEYDYDYFYLNKTEGGMMIVRNGRNIRVFADSNEGTKEYSLLLQFPETTNAFVTPVSNETNDNIQTIKDSFGGKLISIEFNVNNTDSDEIQISTEKVGTITIQQFSGDQLYVGSLPWENYCGRESGGKEVAHSSYVVLEKDQKIFLARYSITGWWYL